MAAKKTLSLLRVLGLSKNEAMVYLYLLDKAEGEPLNNILKGCGLSGSELNPVLVSLVDRGFVAMSSNAAIANPPQKSLFAALEMKERELGDQIIKAGEAAKVLQDLLGATYWEKRLGIRPMELLESLEDLSSMELRTAGMIAGAKESIFIFAESFDWYGKIRKQLVSSLGKGVKAKVLMMVVDDGSAARSRELEGMGVEVRHCAEKWYPVRGTLVDNRELVFLIWATRKDIEHPICFRPHYTKNLGLIRIFSDAFEKRWESGRPIVV